MLNQKILSLSDLVEIITLAIKRDAPVEIIAAEWLYTNGLPEAADEFFSVLPPNRTDDWAVKIISQIREHILDAIETVDRDKYEELLGPCVASPHEVISAAEWLAEKAKGLHDECV